MIRKKLIIFICIIIMIGFNYSCAKKEPAQSPASDILTGKISGAFSEFNISLDKDIFDGEYDFTKVENFSVKQSEYGEAGIFKLYSKVSVDYIKEMAAKRVLKLQESSESLEKLSTANNAEVRSYGNYVYYVSHAEKDNIFRIIEDELKGVSKKAEI